MQLAQYQNWAQAPKSYFTTDNPQNICEGGTIQLHLKIWPLLWLTDVHYICKIVVVIASSLINTSVTLLLYLQDYCKLFDTSKLDYTCTCIWCLSPCLCQCVHAHCTFLFWSQGSEVKIRGPAFAKSSLKWKKIPIALAASISRLVTLSTPTTRNEAPKRWDSMPIHAARVGIGPFGTCNRWEGW